METRHECWKIRPGPVQCPDKFHNKQQKLKKHHPNY
jgi:hypothetical protein